MVMDERTATRQDIRPLKIGLLNLMPNKLRTEAQIARLLGATPLQVELSLVNVSSHKARNTSEEHLISFYHPWQDVIEEKFDGFIITGAPVEQLNYEDVTYWEELTRIFEWTRTNVHSTFNICWGAMAAIYHFHGVPKHTLESKAFGVYRHRNLKPASPLLSGFSDDFSIPVSRWSDVRADDIRQHPGLELLMESTETGPCLVAEEDGRRVYIFNHIEYDSTSLAEEYFRDLEAGTPIALPEHYFTHDDPALPPLNRWRSHAHLLFGNWINQIYQTTPYDRSLIGS